MKKFVIMSIVATLMPLAGNAQDDMYFSPKQGKTEVYVKETPVVEERPYAPCHRDIDEYNRRSLRSRYQEIGNDSTSDTIDFYGNTPDSLYNKKGCKLSQQYYDEGFDDGYDYAYSRRLHYFDDFWWYNDPWYYGYTSIYGPYYGWYGYGWRPWRYGYSYYWDAPWYYGYAGWYGGWYDPWYYGGGGWHHPHYGGGGMTAHNPNNGGVTGTSNHGWVGRSNRTNVGFSGYRGSTSTSARNTDAYNRHSSAFTGTRRMNENSMRRYDSSMQTRDYNSGYRNNSNFDSGASRSSSFSNGGGGFSGGGHGGGGGFGGGGRSGGGGHFGGRR